MHRRPSFVLILIIITGLLSTLSGVVGNIAASQVPPAALPFLRFSWLILVILMVLLIAVAVWQYRLQNPSENSLLSIKASNRQRLIAKVRAFWIKGVLYQSLHGAALIALGLDEQMDAIATPWGLILRQSGASERPLPAGTSVTQVYDDASGELLILGEPGSGKTTLLLELARNLLDRAEQDDALPIPVVFNLSSWAVKRQSITAWLVEELSAKYQVPRKLGQAWINDEQILPLLDGLDEVAPSHRTACIDALNTYHGEHGLLAIVICSRSTEYLSQTRRLQLRSAVVVQPLTADQIDDYLSSAGEKLAAVGTALREDAVLRELATTPLMLSVLALAYSERPVEDLRMNGSLEEHRRKVFATYVNRMLQRRVSKSSYNPEQTKHWLAWLAQQLAQHNQTEFYLERMQPDWLPKNNSQQFFRAVVGGLIGALAIGTLGLQLFKNDARGIIFIPFFGLVGALIGSAISLFKSARTTSEENQTRELRLRQDTPKKQSIPVSPDHEKHPEQQLSSEARSLGAKIIPFSHLPRRRGMLAVGLLFGVLGGLGSELLGRQRLAFHHLLFSILFFGLCGALAGSWLSSQKSKVVRLLAGSLCCGLGGFLVSQSPLGGLVGGLVGAGLGSIMEERRTIVGLICFGALGAWLSTFIYRIDLPLIWQLNTLVGSLFLGMVSGCCGGLLLLLPNIVGTRIIVFKRPSWSWLRLYYSRFNYYREHIVFLVGTVATGLLVGILYGAVIALLEGLIYSWLYRESIVFIVPNIALVVIPITAIIGSLLMLILSIIQTNIVPVETFSWSWRHAVRRLTRFSSWGLFGGFFIHILTVILSIREYTAQNVMYSIEHALPNLYLFLVIGGLIGVILCLSIGGFSSNILEKQRILSPNQGIRNSMRYGLLAGISISLFLFALYILSPFIIFFLYYRNIYTIPNIYQYFHYYINYYYYNTIISITLIILFLGSFFSLLSGGTACLKHIVLRFLLWQSGCIPQNYVHFLDTAADHILLRKVGGGYIFIHRLLLEYFASPVISIQEEVVESSPKEAAQVQEKTELSGGTEDPQHAIQKVSRRTVISGLAGAGGAGAITGALTSWVHMPHPIYTYYPVYTYYSYYSSPGSIAWSPDSTRIASFDGAVNIQIWNATNGEDILSRRDNQAYYQGCIAWSPDGKYLASPSEGLEDSQYYVDIWDATSGRGSGSYAKYPAPIESVAWSPNGLYVATASMDHTVQVWSVATNELRYIYQGHNASVQVVAWSPDGSRVASASADATVQVWESTGGKHLYTYRGHPIGVNAISWSPDSNYIASCGDTTVQVWDANDGRRMHTYHGHPYVVFAVAWSPDGKHIASGGLNTVQVWDATSGTPIYTYRGHYSWVEAVAWSPNGKYIASASADGTVQVWEAPHL
jgi:uncharacterized protein with WD repeat